jgi:hypothetical protein
MTLIMFFPLLPNRFASLGGEDSGNSGDGGDRNRDRETKNFVKLCGEKFEMHPFTAHGYCINKFYGIFAS